MHLPPGKAFPAGSKSALFQKHNTNETKEKMGVTWVTITGMLSDVVMVVEVVGSRCREKIHPRMMAELSVRCTMAEVQ